MAGQGLQDTIRQHNAPFPFILHPFTSYLWTWCLLPAACCLLPALPAGFGFKLLREQTSRASQHFELTARATCPLSHHTPRHSPKPVAVDFCRPLCAGYIFFMCSPRRVADEYNPVSSVVRGRVYRELFAQLPHAHVACASRFTHYCSEWLAPTRGNGAHGSHTPRTAVPPAWCLKDIPKHAHLAC